MDKTYTTRQGDTWDAIAYAVYGSESLTGWLMQNNFPHLDVFVFDAGVILQTPEPPAAAQTGSVPFWRTGG